MKQPTVSITVPIYNMEQYMRQCLDSIVAQTFTDWECWLIDDGSTDGSPAICDEYAARDHRFHVIHQPNAGVSAARQCGLDHSTGKYITQIDPDDWVDAQHIENMVVAANSGGVNIVHCDFYWSSEKGERYASNRPTDNSPRTLQKMLLHHEVHAGLWRMMIERRLFTDYDVRFPKWNYHEDVFVVVSLLQYAKRIVHLPKASYHYRTDNPSSYTNSADMKKRIRLFEEFALNMETLCEKYSFDNDPDMSAAFDFVFRYGKMPLLQEFYNDYSLIKPLFLRYRPNCYQLHYCHNIKDFLYYLAARYGFVMPFRLHHAIKK